MDKVKVVAKRIDWNYIESNYGELVDRLYLSRREAVKGYKNQKAALEAVATGMLLQQIIEEELGISPDNLVIQKNQYGKPYVCDVPEFSFNISHSADVVMIGYGNTSVGVDVEEVKKRSKDVSVVERCFAPEEKAFIMDGIGSELEKQYTLEERFFMVWTMKEAYLKYLGTGINIPLNSFVVEPLEGRIAGKAVKADTILINNYVYSICVPENCDVEFELL